MNLRYATTLAVLALLIPVGSTHAQVTVLSENFDAVTEPDLPPSWTASGSGWSTSTSSPSTGSGINNLMHSGSTPGIVTTPIVNLSNFSSGYLSYLARRTSSYPQDSLTVLASIDGGVTFPVVVAGAGSSLPLATSSYEAVVVALPGSLDHQSSVVFRFDGMGGTTGGSNLRIDDVLITALAETTPPPPSSSENLLGFAVPASSYLEATDSIRVAVRLDAVDSLQGLQFDVSWSSSIVALNGVERGAAISDTSRWQLSWDQQGNLVRVLLLDSISEGLPPATYDHLVDLTFASGLLAASTADTVTLSLTGAIGAISDPSGTDARLGISQGVHDMEIYKPRAFLSVSVDSLDFGVVDVDSVAVQDVTLSNASGTLDLQIYSLGTNNPAFTIADSAFVLSPGSSQAVQVIFAPTATAFGTQSGELIVGHDGANGPSEIVPLSGLGVGGRGDVNVDGIVDVVDVLSGIDASLFDPLPETYRPANADLYPFPGGDGTVDVRDLTVLVQAIVHAVWPDDAPLPERSPFGQSPAVVSAFNEAEFVSSDVSLKLIESANGVYEVILSPGNTDLRGIEMAFSGIDAASASEPPVIESSASISQASSYYDKSAGTFRLLIATSRDLPLPHGDRWLGRIESSMSDVRKTISYIVGVDLSGNRVHLSPDNVLISTGIESEDTPKDQFMLGAPYPDPFINTGDSPLRIPVSVPGQRSDTVLEIFDILGRRLLREIVPRSSTEFSWNPEDRDRTLSPGLYLVRLSSGRNTASRTFTVLRGS